MFGKKSKLERVKADAKADYLKCSALDPEDRLHRVFAARIAQRARLNLDKIFVQGAKAEEKRQHEMAEAIKAGSGIPPRIVHEGYNQLQGISGSVVSWVPEELANKMWQQKRIIEYMNEMPIIQVLIPQIEADDIISYVTQMKHYDGHDHDRRYDHYLGDW